MTTIQHCPGAHPASFTKGTGSFPGVKRPGRGVDHPPAYSAEVKERVELYLYSPSESSWLVLGWPLPLSKIPVFWDVTLCVQEELNCLTLKTTAQREWSPLTLTTMFGGENIQILPNTFVCITAWASLHWSPFVRCFACNVPEVKRTAELHLSGSWLSGSPVIRIGLALRVNLSRIQQN
jgi:hypothetical protein